MPAAKRAILACHGLAKAPSDPADIALCHAVGQGLRLVHTKGHAMGLPIYELTAVVQRYGLENSRTAVEKAVCAV